MTHPKCPGCGHYPAERRRFPNAEKEIPLEDLPLGLCGQCSSMAYCGETEITEELGREVLRLRQPPEGVINWKIPVDPDLTKHFRYRVDVHCVGGWSTLALLMNEADAYEYAKKHIEARVYERGELLWEKKR